jgi:DNA-binding transcriptional regulator LsrR (DeoR family)
MAAAVARRHYLLRQSKVEIAQALGVSRFKVARLLDLAHEAGMVRIEIAPADEIDLDRSARLQERFGLHHAVVVDGVGLEPRMLYERLGAAAARLLSEILTEDDVLGLPWSRSVDFMTRALREAPRVDVVQLSGALDVPGHDSSAVDIVRRVARLTGGDASVFYAPLLLDDAAGAATLRREPQVARALDRASSVTTAVMGVGAWSPGLSTVFDAAAEADRREVARAGVVGEMGGVFFDVKGRVVEPALSGRILSLRPQDLLGIREVVAMAYGAAKADAVRAALAGGLARSLVTDTSLADALLVD